MGGTLENERQRGLSESRSSGTAPACLCLHTVRGGRGTGRLIRACSQRVRHASSDKHQRFDQIKKKRASQSRSSYATQQGMLTNIPGSH